MGALEEDADPMVFRIAEETNRILEARRKKEDAKRMARLMRNFNYDLLKTGVEEEAETQGGIPVDLELDDLEAERIRRLREVEEEIIAGAVARQSGQPPSKYESPMIVQLRAVETVDELYQLADQIIPLVAKKC